MAHETFAFPAVIGPERRTANGSRDAGRGRKSSGPVLRLTAD
jgi:hypothetical protein